ncbi:uncharacterized protein LOC106176337 [Lingula anatina]|uniref:Uncharacterized protein LOC106176337 n=1 Tax=Lingula anatina TaxID=7574 RepID=A0A1S3JVL5_LINAN|nr:uncharacterized protein LOC106176337 [Lingula anatina]|eukprot:XP_013414129.1 uncharacterized protein LOC106176337 [Lingula anatina]
MCQYRYMSNVISFRLGNGSQNTMPGMSPRKWLLVVCPAVLFAISSRQHGVTGQSVRDCVPLAVPNFTSPKCDSCRWHQVAYEAVTGESLTLNCSVNVTGPYLKMCLSRPGADHPPPVCRECDSSIGTLCTVNTSVVNINSSIQWTCAVLMMMAPPGCTTERANKLNITVKARAPLTATDGNSPHNVSVHVGDKVMFNCTASGYPSPTVCWRHGNRTLLNSTAKHIIFPNGTLQLKNVNASDAGDYVCEWSNRLETNTWTASLTVTDSSNSTPPPSTAEYIFGGSVLGVMLIALVGFIIYRVAHNKTVGNGYTQIDDSTPHYYQRQTPTVAPGQAVQEGSSNNNNSSILHDGYQGSWNDTDNGSERAYRSMSADDPRGGILTPSFQNEEEEPWLSSLYVTSSSRVESDR